MGLAPETPHQIQSRLSRWNFSHQSQQLSVSKPWPIEQFLDLWAMSKGNFPSFVERFFLMLCYPISWAQKNNHTLMNPNHRPWALR